MNENKGLSYKDAGVDIDAGNQAVQLLKDKVNETHGPEVLAGVGAFGGLYDLSCRVGGAPKVLAASTDGVGTKVRLATESKQFAGLGADLVNHCINDILVQGARPLVGRKGKGWGLAGRRYRNSLSGTEIPADRADGRYAAGQEAAVPRRYSRRVGRGPAHRP